MAVPLMFLYEISILVSRYAGRKKKAGEENAAAGVLDNE